MRRRQGSPGLSGAARPAPQEITRRRHPCQTARSAVTGHLAEADILDNQADPLMDRIRALECPLQRCAAVPASRLPS